MPSFRNSATRVVVSIADAATFRLGPGWEPVAPVVPAERPAPKARTTRKKK